jgi:mono/diheme cytochrome c family protein
MEEVGRRFELAGRAAQARRFELAAFEAHELGEVFEEDLPHAELPKEGSTEAIRTLAEAFATEHPKALVEAAVAKDVDRFADAFARAADACNACHQTTGHGFVEVPREPGSPVPDVSPASASAAPVGTPPTPASARP